ncbi:MAG: LytTR family transcriptional regulator DNA-binding domain-containing protein [Oscillospiraceae bacterium]
MSEKSITIISNRKHVTIRASTILYIIMNKKNVDVHVTGGEKYTARVALDELEKELGDSFIRVHRNCLVAVMAIHDIKEQIELVNGELISYSPRNKKKIAELLSHKRKMLISGMTSEGTPRTLEEFHRHYRSFDYMPFAFTDIEMVFNNESHAVDWIFRYGNPALAKLEKLPLEYIVGKNFKQLFSNMDSKWLRSYERAALYGETLEIIDYSPEIDKYLKIICFPTFRGHCGCILFDISQIEYAQCSTEADKALLLYFGIVPSEKK